MTWQEDAEVVRKARSKLEPGVVTYGAEGAFAAEIVRLTAALKAAERERDALSPGRWYLLQRAETAEWERDRLKSTLDAQIGASQDQLERAEAAEQRVAELEAALREIARKQPLGVRVVTQLAYVQGLAEDALREGGEK